MDRISNISFTKTYVASHHVEFLGHRLELQSPESLTLTPLSKEMRICKMLLVILKYSFYCVDLSYAVLSVLRPRSPEYLSSLVVGAPEPIWSAGVFLSFLFQAYVAMLSTEPSKVLLGLLSIFMFSMSDFL